MRIHGKPLAIVAIGGALGSVARFELGWVLHAHLDHTSTTTKALLNLAGSFVVGFVIQFVVNKRSIGSQGQLFLITGLVGGYTTCAAFSPEALAMIDAGMQERAIVYMGASFVLSVLGAALGGLAATKLTIRNRVSVS